MTRKNQTEDELFFVSFCIEEYKARRDMTGGEVAVLFEKYGVTDFLMEHFEVLHTLDRDMILDEIDKFIEAGRRKK